MPRPEHVGVYKLVWEKNRWILKAILASGVTAPTVGEWVRVDGVHPITVSIEGTFTGEVRLLGSQNPVNAPGAGTGFPQVGTPFTGPASFQTDGPWMWLKVSIPALSAGSVSIYAMANIPWGS